MTRQTATELVVEDSCLWVAVVTAAGSLPLFYAGAFVGNKGNYIVGGLFLLCALLATRKSRFVFDARERVVRWTNLLIFRTSTGSVPFDDIRGIGIEAMAGDGDSYRLTILSSQKPIPLASSYGPGKEKYTNLRKTIATFLNLEISQEDTAGLDPSVLKLVRAGRTLEAIKLLRTMGKMSLLEAKQIVDEVKGGSKTKP